MSITSSLNLQNFSNSLIQLPDVQTSTALRPIALYFTKLSHDMQSDHYSYDGLTAVEEYCKKLVTPSDINYALLKLREQTSIFFSKQMDKEKLRSEIETRWNLIGALEERYLVVLGLRIDQDPTNFCNMTKDEEDLNYKLSVKNFNQNLTRCTYDLGSWCRQNGISIDQFSHHNRFLVGFPSLFEKFEDQVLLNPITILLSLTKEQLGAKDPKKSMRDFLLPFQNQFMHDLSSKGIDNNQMIELFNSNFFIFRFALPFSNLPLQIVTSLNNLVKIIDIPSVHEILIRSYNQFIFLPSKEVCQADRLKIIGSYLNLAYKLTQDGIKEIIKDKYQHLKRLTFVTVEWRELEGLDVEHSLGKDKIILYADPKKVDHRKLASWSSALGGFFPNIDYIVIPNDWFCSSGQKRIRADQNEDAPLPKRFKSSSSSASSAKQANDESENAEMDAFHTHLIPREAVFDDCILSQIPEGKTLIVNGFPNKPWNQSDFTHVLKHRAASKIELPIEYLYLCSGNAGISAEVVDDLLPVDCDDEHQEVSFSLQNTNDKKLENELAYLNRLKNVYKIVVKVESEEDIPFLVNIARGTQRQLKIDLKADGFTQDFDCNKLATELSLSLQPDKLLSILMPFILAFPERSSTVSAFSYLLEKEDVFKALIEGAKMKELTYNEMETLMILVNTNKQEWARYPQLLLEVLDNFIMRNRDTSLIDIDKSFEQLFIYLLDNKVLSLKNWSLLEDDVGFEWIINILLFRTPETNKIAKNFLFMVDPILRFCLRKNDIKKYFGIASLFVQLGYIPPCNEEMRKLKIWHHLLFPVLAKSIPHTSKLKNQWVYEICATFFPYNGVFDNNAQRLFLILLNYNNFDKKHTFVFVEPKFLNRELFFTVFKNIFTHHKYMCENEPFRYFVWLEKYIDQLKQYETDTQKFYETIVLILTLMDDQIALQNKASSNARIFMKNFLGSLKESYPGLQEKLLKKMVIFSKEPYKKKIFSQSEIVAGYLLKKSQQLSEETMKLCARAAVHSPTFIDILDMHPNHRVAFKQAVWNEIKESGDYITTSGMNIANILMELLIEKYRARPPINDLVERGMVIMNFLLKVPYDLTKVLELKESDSDTQNFIKAIIELLFDSPKFRENRNYNYRTLAAILNILPTLNEESQKFYVTLFSRYPHITIQYPEWIARHPIFYNETLTILVKRPRDWSRNIKVMFIAVNCPNADLSKLERVIKSIAPLSQEEFCCISSTQSYFLQCLKRELTDEEKRLEEYGDYQVIQNHMERARPFVEIAPCRQPSSASFLDLGGSLLKLVDFINMDNPKLLNYLNPSFLKIKGVTIQLDEFKENITKLANVLQKRIKITGAPEDDAEREKIYAEFHLYLAHISHLLSQTEIQRCSGFLLAFVEIGANCFKQYPEIPPIYYTLIRQMEVPLSPSWIDLNQVQVPILSGSFNEKLTTQINQMVTAIAQKQVAFDEPLDSAEIDYVYRVLRQKMNVILYLINELDAKSALPCALEKIHSLSRQSPMKLIEGITKPRK